jgi:hypothetical protein
MLCLVHLLQDLSTLSPTSNLKYQQFLLQVAKGQTNDNPKSDTSENDSVDVHPASAKQTPHEHVNRLLLLAKEIRNIQLGNVKYVQSTKADVYMWQRI